MHALELSGKPPGQAVFETFLPRAQQIMGLVMDSDTLEGLSLSRWIGRCTRT